MQMEKKKSWGSSTYICKIDFKTKTTVRDKEGHYIMIKGTIQQEDITLVNIYTPNIGAPKYVKQILLDIKAENNRNSHSRGFFFKFFKIYLLIMLLKLSRFPPSLHSILLTPSLPHSPPIVHVHGS